MRSSHLFPPPQKRGQIHLHTRKVIQHHLPKAASSDYHHPPQMSLWMIPSHGMTTKSRDTTRPIQLTMAMESTALALNQLRPLRGHVHRNGSGKSPNGRPVRQEKLVRSDEKEGMKSLAWTDFAVYTKALPKSGSSSMFRTDIEQPLSPIIQCAFGIVEEQSGVGYRSKTGLYLNNNMNIWAL